MFTKNKVSMDQNKTGISTVHTEDCIVLVRNLSLCFTGDLGQSWWQGGNCCDQALLQAQSVSLL